MSRSVPLLVVCGLLNLASGAEPLPAPKPNLDGTWVFDSVKPEKGDDLNRVWSSIVVVKGYSFAISNIMRNPAPLKGKLLFDPANPKHVDISIEELDFSYFGAPLKVPASTQKALLEVIDANRVKLAFTTEHSSPRPANFQPTATVHVIELCRAPKGFKAFPEEITVTVVNADGKPVEGALVAASMGQRPDAKGKMPGWQYRGAKKTGPDGTTKATIDDPPFVVRDEKTKEMAIPKITPASLATGSIRVVLAPECRVVSSIKSDELTKAGQPLGWSITLLHAHGMTIGSYTHPDGKIEFLLPPGTYTLDSYGENMHPRYVEVTVPAGQSTFEMKPIELKATALSLLKGKPAPEFTNVVGWTGKPVRLADLKGQYVLLDFWGYWCGPCVHAMPVLIELHEKFHDKGLTIVGVHIDMEGEVATVAKFDEMNAISVKAEWKGKKLPFTNALVSGKREGEENSRGGMAKLYGIFGYPTTVLIDPEGKVVGTFQARDVKAATEQMEKLLAGRRK